MNFRQIIKQSFIVGIVIFPAIMLSNAWIFNINNKSSTDPSSETRVSRIFPFTTGIRNKIYGPDGETKSLVEADSYIVAPRRFLIFNFNLLNEVRIENVRVKHYFDKNSPTITDLIPLGNMPISLGGDKATPKRERPMRAIISGIDIEIYRTDRSILLLTAENAIVDKARNIEFRNSRLEDKKSGKQIVSNKIIWNKDNGLFQIPNKYCAVTRKGKACDKRIKVNLDFEVALL
jgi:hypothetical protein